MTVFHSCGLVNACPRMFCHTVRLVHQSVDALARRVDYSSGMEWISFSRLSCCDVINLDAVESPP